MLIAVSSLTVLGIALGLMLGFASRYFAAAANPLVA